MAMKLMKEISAERFALTTILLILMSGNFQLTKCAENIKDVFRPNSSLSPFGSSLENGKCSCNERELCSCVTVNMTSNTRNLIQLILLSTRAVCYHYPTHHLKVLFLRLLLIEVNLQHMASITDFISYEPLCT